MCFSQWKHLAGQAIVKQKLCDIDLGAKQSVRNKMELRNIHTNCVKVRFDAKSKMPTDKEVFAFFRKREWKPNMLTAMFREPREYSVYVKFQSEELMKAELLRCPTTDIFAYDDGQTTTVSFSTARGDFKYIRIFGIPIEVEDKHVANVLSKYGKIHQLVRERYGPDTGYPILNGVRGAHMEVTEALPSQVHIQHFQARIFYEGMQTRCFLCNGTDHVKQNCPKRISVNERLKQNSGTYAGVLTGGISKGPSGQRTQYLAPDNQRPSTSRVVAAERLLAPCEISGIQDDTRGGTDEASSQATAVADTEAIQEAEDQEPEAAAEPDAVATEVAPTGAVSTEEMVIEKSNSEHRKRGHEAASVNENRQDESEASSTEPEVTSKPGVALSSGGLLEKQVKRLRSKNKKSKK